MAYTVSKTYLLFFRQNLIGSITSPYLGLGWITGFFEPGPKFKEFRQFFKEFEETEDNPEFMLPKLERKFGSAILDPCNWALKDLSGNKLNENIPYIMGDIISWRGAR